MLRFAPSPDRELDINSMRVAILNYIIAKKRDEKFLVRIEDINIKNKEGEDTQIILILEKFGIVYDFVYHQTQHKNIYYNLSTRLLKDKKAYILKNNSSKRDSNSPKELNSLSQFTIKLNRPKTDIIIKDRLRGEIKFSPEEIGDITILENGTLPTSTFASACDDILSEISTIVREEKFLIKSAKERFIQHLLDYKEIEYIHLLPISPNITIKELFKKGFIPDAIINYIIAQSYKNPPTEIFYLRDAISWFEIENISTKPIEFDYEKLKFFNREHIKLIDDMSLSRLFGFADVNIGKLAKVYLKEYSTLNELNSKIMQIFKPKDFNSRWEEEMRVLQQIIHQAPPFEKFDEFIEYIKKKSGLKDNRLFKPLSLLLTNKEREVVELSQIYPLIKSYILEVAS